MMTGAAQHPAETPLIHVIDDEDNVRGALCDLLASMGYAVTSYRSASEFLTASLPPAPGCIILDVRMPGASGLDLQAQLPGSGVDLPIILMTGFGDIPMSVKAMKAGAVDFLTKPFRDQEMLDAVAAAVADSQRRRQASAEAESLQMARASLSPRESQIMDLVVTGLMNKQIAGKLGLSEVTVKVHRAAAMRKMGARSVAQLARMAERLEDIR
jgi:FixJ family two-component response regulator